MNVITAARPSSSSLCSKCQLIWDMNLIIRATWPSFSSFCCKCQLIWLWTLLFKGCPRRITFWQLTYPLSCIIRHTVWNFSNLWYCDDDWIDSFSDILCMQNSIVHIYKRKSDKTFATYSEVKKPSFCGPNNWCGPDSKTLSTCQHNQTWCTHHNLTVIQHCTMV